MIDGFTAGYNEYLDETEASELPPQCQGQPWVREISPEDLLAHYRVLAQVASGGQFATGAVFLATPPMNLPSRLTCQRQLRTTIVRNALLGIYNDMLAPRLPERSSWKRGLLVMPGDRR